MTEDKEIAAMTAIAKALDGIPSEEADTRARVLQWACSRYHVKFGSVPGERAKGPDWKEDSPLKNDGQEIAYDSLADLYQATAPDTDVNRALVTGFWLGKGEARGEFTGLGVNRELKNLGHPVANITDALQSLIDKRPSLVIQTAKSGAARQARKKYKLTVAGVSAVEQMIKTPKK